MFGFLAAFGPVGIAAAVVGTVATAVLVSDDSSPKRRSNSKEVQDDYDEENKNKIRNDIESYEKNSIKRIKNKYDIDIEFVESNPYSSHGGIMGSFGEMLHTIKKDKVKIVNKNIVIKNEIKKLKNEVDEITKLIDELEVEKYEANG